MLFLAAELPFDRVIGVEYSPDLYQTLQRNVATYRRQEQRCGTIEAVLEDATQYPLPKQPAVIFFHHPFEAPVFRQVMDRIEQSLAETPREIIAIYYDPACRELFDRSKYFQLMREGRRDPSERYTSNWLIYGTRPMTTSPCFPAESEPSMIEAGRGL
jgi:hypothetical protein